MAKVAELTRDKVIDRFRERITLERRTKLYKAEFEALVADCVEQLSTATSEDEIERICKAEIALLEEGYPQLTLASDYIPKYRKAIEDAIANQTLPLNADTAHNFTRKKRVTGQQEKRAEHYALTHFKYDLETYEALDQRQAKVNRRRLLNLKAVNPQPYLEILDELLQSQDNFQARHLAIAIAGLSGRRLGEVLARGSFSLVEHPHLLHFEGQQKHDRSGYDIITLIPAKDLLAKIQYFRGLKEIKALMKLKGTVLTEAINKFDVQVNRECNKYLHVRNEAVPVLEGRKNVTVHNLRSLWGAISVWMFCPPEQHEYAFMQHYLGHVLESPATGHYFRYQLVDAKGKPIGKKGVRLAEVPPLPLLDADEEPEAEITPEPQPEPATEPKAKAKAAKSKAKAKTAKPKAKAKATKPKAAPQVTEPKPEVAIPANAIAQLKQEFEAQLQQLKDELHQEWLEKFAATQTTQTTPANSDWLMARIPELEAANKALQEERDALQAQVASYEELQATYRALEQTNQTLTTQLNDAEAKLGRFRELILGEPAPAKAAIATPVKATTEAGDQLSLPQMDVPAESSNSKPTRGRKPGKAAVRAMGIFEALKAWNQAHPDDTLALNPGLLETEFRVHRQAAKKFCEDQASAIEAHHQQIGVVHASAHNRGKDIEGFKAFVKTLGDE